MTERDALALTDPQAREVRLIAKDEVREYFDYYLREVVPAQEKARREFVHLMIEKHDDAETAHGGVEFKFRRVLWLLSGAAALGGGTGVGLSKVLAVLGA